MEGNIIEGSLFLERSNHKVDLNPQLPPREPVFNPVKSELTTYPSLDFITTMLMLQFSLAFRSIELVKLTVCDKLICDGREYYFFIKTVHRLKHQHYKK